MTNSNFTVYKSSAGSGKTFTLVKEYLKLALKDKHQLTSNYKGILAITFTNKAASEMKWRIIKGLQEIGENKNEFLIELVSTELSITTDELKDRATIVLTDILHHYSDFSIGTIDSFTHRIIRTFAIDLQLPMNFQIEMDADEVFRKVISTLMANLGKDDLITNYLVQYSIAQVDDNKHWDPEKTLLDFIKEINKEGVGELIKQLEDFDIQKFDSIKKQISAYKKEYEISLKKSGEAGLKLIYDKQLNGEELANGKSGIYNFFVKLTKLIEISEEELFTKTVLKTIEEDKWYAAKATENDKVSIDSIKQNLEGIVLEVKRYIDENEAKYKVYQLIYKNIYAMGLVNELAKLTAEYKANENILFISEFNEKISNVVNDEPTPFIFERLGDRYRHFLLDEFQDTSTTQWNNMLPLIDNSLGNGNMNLVVGDGKQSIYRWRNADVEQFVNLPYNNKLYKNDILIEREQSLIRNFKEEFLTTNYRSKPIIVQFNNNLFNYLSNKLLTDELKPIYFKQEQQSIGNDRGYVSLDFPLVEDEKDEINLKYILKYINLALNDGYQYNDICIIIRKNGDGNTIANFLIEQEIPVVSADSLLLNSANEITVIISFLKYLFNQKDLVSASVIINYLRDSVKLDDDTYVRLLRELNTSNGKSLFQILNECDIQIDIQKLTTGNLFDSCIEISSILKLNEKNPQYIRFFIDEVLSFLQSHTSNLKLFLDWWERKSSKASLVIPEGINAINIMTIHASKGLEFPVVISPYLSLNTLMTSSIWVNVDESELDMPVALINTTKQTVGTVYERQTELENQLQILDSLNLLYVDFTRAVDRLHIISPKPKLASKDNTYHWLNDYATNQSHYDNETLCLNYGSLESKGQSVHQKKGLEQVLINNLDLNQNPDLVKIKNSSQFSSLERLEQAREYGILVHYILSKLNYVSELPDVIANFKISGEINEEEAIAIEKDVIALLSNPLISCYYETGVQVKNEIEILTEDGFIIRPDRVVIRNNEAIVIDYKTGKIKTTKYQEQMNSYEIALLKLGYTSVKKILLYIKEQEIEFI